MNWGSIFSAVLGALIGGCFLLVGQRYVIRENYKKAKRIVLLESLRNLENLNENVELIETSDNPTPIQVTFNIKLDSFFRFEEDLVSGSLAEFQEISKSIVVLQNSKVKVRYWTPGSDMLADDIIENSKKTVSESLTNCIALVEGLSKELSSKELLKVGKNRIVEEAKRKIPILQNSDVKFSLVLPYEEWPRRNLENFNGGIING